ncbi:hypothetical protein HRQ91_11555 [Treponema parvum]|uniref:Dimethylmenaquinone methyltransferase n=1 Tax=Treponema parvum TaxID=138851 RepID=A0A975IGE3_9SPIR|nr:hypothetical protein [Treponema parvum]QTQ15044.1 hypothetical protein HRQ91_11555 [Treponema parvum]
MNRHNLLSSHLQGYASLFASELLEPIYLPGHLTHYVIVNPGDFIFGDDDGLQIIPEPYVDSVLLKAEEILSFENEERKMIADGLPIEEVYKKFGDL